MSTLPQVQYLASYLLLKRFVTQIGNLLKEAWKICDTFVLLHVGKVMKYMTDEKGEKMGKVIMITAFIPWSDIYESLESYASHLVCTVRYLFQREYT